MLIPGKCGSHPCERQRVALQPLQHGQQIAHLRVGRICLCQPLVLQHSAEHQHAAAAGVAPVTHDVIGVAVDQTLEVVYAAAYP